MTDKAGGQLNVRPSGVRAGSLKTAAATAAVCSAIETVQQITRSAP